MNEYFKALNPIAQRRYIAKLQLLDLAEEDPYAQQNGGKFVGDVRWSMVTFFCYYIERPGVHTGRELMQWKSLEAYNYFQSGHIRKVTIWPLSNSYCILLSLQILMCAFGSQWSLHTVVAHFAVLPRSASGTDRKEVPLKEFTFPTYSVHPTTQQFCHLRSSIILAIQHVSAFPPRGVAHVTSGLISSLFSDNMSP